MLIVVTGALGHIGSRLIRDFGNSFPAATVRLIDNLATQRYPSLFNLPSGVNYEFIEADVLNADLPVLFRGADVVIHLAAITMAADSFALREQVEQNNYQGTCRVAEACVRVGAALFFPSTSSVYGTTRPTISEDCVPEELQPQSPYAATKLKEEEYVRRLGQQSGLRYVIARFGTIFGTSPGMRFHTAVNKFCWQAVMRQPITVWETAMDQKRPYLDLQDATRLITFMITRQLFDGRVYNVVTTNTTVRTIIDLIKQRLPQSQVQLVKAEIMNSLSYDVLSDRLLGLGWQYRGSLPQAIVDTITLLSGAYHVRDAE